MLALDSFKTFVTGKRVTVLGLGLLGRGVGDAAFLAECGATVTVTDKKTEAELAASVARLKKYPTISFHLGGHVEEDFTKADMVIKAAGVRLDSPEIAAAKAAGVPVAMSTALFAKYADAMGVTLVGVTGTRGKSTVTQMIYHTLARTGKRVHLGGNVRGVSTLALLPEIQAGDVVVLELDSWQLQGFGDLGISPHVAVFTNLMPDHQNYYPNMETYFSDKANIFRYQRAGDFLFAGMSVIERLKAARPSVAPLVPPAIPSDWHLNVIGAHNRSNAACAIAALRALGLSDDNVRAGLESFESVEGRLQFVREINPLDLFDKLRTGKLGAGGIKIYNDNNATTPEATIAALRALDAGKKNIVLICGGADKGLDAGALLYEIAKTCKRVICLAGTGTSRIAPLMTDYSIYDSLDAAVREAIASAEPGDIVLFSPAFASFGMFKNEYDRNDQFMSIVQNV